MSFDTGETQYVCYLLKKGLNQRAVLDNSSECGDIFPDLTTFAASNPIASSTVASSTSTKATKILKTSLKADPPTVAPTMLDEVLEERSKLDRRKLTTTGKRRVFSTASTPFSIILTTLLAYPIPNTEAPVSPRQRVLEVEAPRTKASITKIPITTSPSAGEAIKSNKSFFFPTTISLLITNANPQ